MACPADAVEILVTSVFLTMVGFVVARLIASSRASFSAGGSVCSSALSPVMVEKAHGGLEARCAKLLRVVERSSCVLLSKDKTTVNKSALVCS